MLSKRLKGNKMSNNFYNEHGEITLTDKEKAEFWERFVKGLTKDLEFHRNLNKEKAAKIKELEEKLEAAVEEIKRLEGSLLTASSIRSHLRVLLEKLKE